MDLALTRNGDLMLEEVFATSHEIGFNFFIKPRAHAICVKFDIAQQFVPNPRGTAITFEIRKQEDLYDVPILDDAHMLKQMCYNAIRTQKNSLSHALTFGSDIYLEKNKKITNGLLEHLAFLAKEAIKEFAPEAIVTASTKLNSLGANCIVFTIHTTAHTLKLDYLI